MRYSTYNAIPQYPKSKKHPYQSLEKERYARKTAAKKAAEEAARAEILKGTAYELPPQESEMQRSA